MTMLLVQHGKNADYDVLVTDNEGNPRDITGIDLQFMAKARFADPDAEALVLLSTPDDITVEDQGEKLGHATIHVTGAATDTLPNTPARLLWECSTDEGWVVDAGVLLVTPEVIEG